MCKRNQIIEGKDISGNKFVQRVKPLFFVPEDEIRTYAKKMKFPVLYEKCPCAIGTYRVETRAWMNEISDRDKLKIVESFQKRIPELSKKVTQQIIDCKICQFLH